MPSFKKILDFKCSCGETMEVSVELKNAGFEGSGEADREAYLDYSFGDLRIEVYPVAGS